MMSGLARPFDTSRRWSKLSWIVAACVPLLAALAGANSPAETTNNWAVLVCTSRYWFNYRHMANTLGMYRTVKRLGIPDSNIILMLADDVACNARNSIPGKVFANSGRHLDLYGESIEVDYRNYEVSVESFIRLLTGRTSPDTPVAKRLDTNENSNIFIYMTGHGGDEFLKFQDQEEISAYDIADAFQQMHTQKRYKEIFFMIDTCQATTMYSKFYSPGIIATGSSGKGENSYSHHSDPDLGIAVIDRFTHVVLNYLEDINKTSTRTLQDLFNRYNPEEFRSNAGVRTDLYGRGPSNVKLTEFFGGVTPVSLEKPGAPSASQQRPSDDGLPRNGSHQQVRSSQSRTRRTPELFKRTETEPITIPFPAWKPFRLSHELSKEEYTAKTRHGQSIHVEAGAALLMGHALCVVLWQCYKHGMFATARG